MMQRFAVTVAVEASSVADATGVFTPTMPRATKLAPTIVSRQILVTWTCSPT